MARLSYLDAGRVALAEDATYLQCRKAVIDFLYTRQAHVEKAA